VRRPIVLVLTVLAFVGTAWADGEPGLERSVVRIVNYAQRGNWYSPWNVSVVGEMAGTGFVIEGGLVMTNAHVVSDSRLLLLFLHNDPNPHHAEVFQIAHDCDLALVRPKEPDLLRDVPPLGFGSLPRLGSTVDTLGYPVGGTQVSSTRGVVSRIEAQLYLHSAIDQHLTVQTDAALNPGNSGGPVIQNDRVVGVAFQIIPDLQSVGYFIPPEVIHRFLQDVADGRYDGYPDLGAETAGMENPAARARAGMLDGETGVVVDMVYPDSSADGSIRAGDVILAVESLSVANDGTVEEGRQRFPFGMLVDRMQIGESVTLRILRQGERLDVSVPVRRYVPARKHGNIYDRLPRYYIHGGLVFVPLDLEMLKTFGENWPTEADKLVLYEFLQRPMDEPELVTKERVVLLRRLDHPVNADMAWYRNQVVERVNGRTIHRLEDLIEAIESHEGEFHLLEFSSFRRFGVLDRRRAEESNAEILERYGVPRDRNL
jgi:S1-C subfamily serine protease